MNYSLLRNLVVTITNTKFIQVSADNLALCRRTCVYKSTMLWLNGNGPVYGILRRVVRISFGTS